MEMMGFPSALMDEMVASAPRGFEVWPANLPVLDAWLTIATQWRVEAMADGRIHWLGLDYNGVRAGLRMAAVRMTPSIWTGIQCMERAAAAVLNGERTVQNDA